MLSPVAIELQGPSISARSRLTVALFHIAAFAKVQRIGQKWHKMKDPLYPGYSGSFKISQKCAVRCTSLTKKVKVVSVGAGVPLPRRPKHSTPWGAVA